MKQNLTVTVIALVGLFCPAWEGAVAGSGSVETYFDCNFGITANGQPASLHLKVGTLRPFLGGSEAMLTGFNTTNGAFVDGKVIQRSSGSLFLNYNEFPNNSAQQIRTAYIDIPATLNYPWTGFVLDNTQSGNFRGNLLFNSGTCTTVTG